METEKSIVVTYSTVDRQQEQRSFPTLKHAQDFAHYWVGEHPELARTYAISEDGISMATVKGATLSALFPEPATATSVEGPVS